MFLMNSWPYCKHYILDLVKGDCPLAWLLIWLFFFTWQSHKDKSQELEKKIQELESNKTNPGSALCNLSLVNRSTFFSNIKADLAEHVNDISCVHIQCACFVTKLVLIYLLYFINCTIWVHVICISDEEYQETLKDLEVTRRNLQVHVHFVLHTAQCERKFFFLRWWWVHV